jgi:Fe-Mn family superoxide dismutase
MYEGLVGIGKKINLINEQILIVEKQNIRENFIMEMKKIGIEKLPYSYSALNKFVDPETMDVHYNKHYKGYVKKLNDALSEKKHKDLELEDIIKSISKFDEKVRNNAGGAFNHALFWKMLSPTKQIPKGDVLEKITKQYGNIKKLKDEFNQVAKDRFGSGWVWLVLTKTNRLKIMSTPNQDNPLMNVVEGGGYPLLGLDVWEHAYYLRYRNKRDQYINRFWNHINWEFVNDLYELRTNKKENINESNDPKEKIILKWLDKKFGNLTPVLNNNNSIKSYVDQNGNGIFLYFNHPKIKTMFFNRDYWDIIQNVFNLYDYEITPIIRTWLKETYNIPGFKDISTPSPKTFPYF